MKKDIVLGAVSGYAWNKVEMWALSLLATGFEGIGAVIVYEDEKNDNADVIAKLESIGFQVISLKLNGSVFNNRFLDFYNVLSAPTNDLRYAVVTDVRDVYFQRNPIEWLEMNVSEDQLYAASECIKYKDEDWGKSNITSGFGPIGERIMEKAIYNVGVLSGGAKAVADMCLAVNMVAKSTNYPVADQSGYNIILDMAFVKSSTLAHSSSAISIDNGDANSMIILGQAEDGYAVQAGTVADPNKIEGFRPLLLEPEPVNDDGIIRTSIGDEYYIVHQYDRVLDWDLALRKKLNEKLAAIRAKEAEESDEASIHPE